MYCTYFDSINLTIFVYFSNTLRRTKSSQLQSVSSENDKKAFLGRDDKDFEFSHVAHLQIEFAESTAVNKDQHNPMDLEQVKMWLTKVA